MIRVENIKKYFPIKDGFFNNKSGDVKAVENVSFEIPEGEILGLVGESGSGKSTLGRAIIRLIEPTQGNIFYKNKNITKLSDSEMRKLRKDFQIIFQDPYASLDPRKKILILFLKVSKFMKKWIKIQLIKSRRNNSRCWFAKRTFK